MHRILTSAALAAALLAAPAASAEEFTFDPSHTHILFSISHFGFSHVRGEFTDFDGTIAFDPEAPESTSVDVTIDAASLDSGWPARDDHLRTADFFDVDTHPTITFRSTGVEVTGEDTARMTGDLTMLGQTHPVTLDVQLNAIGPHPFRAGVTVAGFTATGTIDRTAYGLSYGSPAIGDAVEITIETELNSGG